MDGAGHGGTYGEIHAGKFGKAGVAFFDFTLKGDVKAEAAIFEPTGLTADGWEIETKGWN
jgi:hypothetical protein